MTTILERGGVVTPDPTGARIKVRVITAGVGSSGMYPAEAIESAAPLIQRGTPIYADHPTVTESYDRPERSVRDLVGFFETPGEYVTESHAVDAEATILPQWREAVAAMAEHIGMSIRASAEVDESQGKRIIKRITSIESVDLVTKAGRGGKVLELLESARPDTAAQVRVPAPVAEAVSSDVRSWLSRAAQAAHGSSDRWVWVRDHDDAYVYFESEGPMGRAAMYRQAYTLGDGDVTLTGEAEEVNAETTYKPVTAPGDTTPPVGTTTESHKEDEMPNIQEGNQNPEQANVTEADVQKFRADITEANSRIRKANEHLAEHIVREAFAGIEAPRTTARVIKDAVEEAGHDALDPVALKESATAEAAEFLAAAGAGRPNGLGSAQESTTKLSESDVDRSLAAAFGRQIKEA